MPPSILRAKRSMALLASLVVVALLWFFTQGLADNVSYALAVRLVTALLALAAWWYFFVSYRLRALESDRQQMETHNQSLELRLASLNALECHDAVTGLPVARDRLEHAVRRAQRGKRLLAIYRVRLDAPKSDGQTAWAVSQARVTRQKADNMRSVLRGVDSIVHLGNRDLLVIVEALDKLEDIVAVNHKLAQALQMPVPLNDANGTALSDRAAPSDQVSLAVYPMDGYSATSLLAAAESHLENSTKVAVHTCNLLAQAVLFDWSACQAVA